MLWVSCSRESGGADGGFLGGWSLPCVSFLCLPLVLNYIWATSGIKSACFLETETVCSKDSEVPSAWLFVQSLPLQYGMQELIAVLKIDEYVSSQTTFSHSKCKYAC